MDREFFAGKRYALGARGGTIATMSSRAPIPAYLSDRCCLTCGFRGRELQGRRGLERLVCPQCRQDFYARPPRTYAEMEGLAEPVASPSATLATPEPRRLALLRFAGGLLGAGLSLVRSSGRSGGRQRRRALVQPRAGGRA